MKMVTVEIGLSSILRRLAQGGFNPIKSGLEPKKQCCWHTKSTQLGLQPVRMVDIQTPINQQKRRL
jgi:hypothetical protein